LETAAALALHSKNNFYFSALPEWCAQYCWQDESR